MSKVAPFGFPRVFGFGDGRHSRGRYPIEYYYSQGMQKGLQGLATGYCITKKKDSTDISGMTNIKWFADNGTVFAIDDSGNVMKETTPGAADFTKVHTVSSSNGAGLIGDQNGRILAFGNTAIDMWDGASWTTNWKTGLFAWQHPADTYEDMVVFGNGDSVAIIDSADNLNLAALSLPSSLRVNCVKAGKHGILIGANLGYRGILLLWDGSSDRAIAPWIWTSGEIQSIERVDTGWVVVTQKQILFTNGYTTKDLFPLLDDPLGFNQYTVGAQGTLVINNKLLLLQQSTNSGRMKPGLYLFDLATTLFEFVPVSTLNTQSVTPLAIYAAKTGTQEVLVGYQDSALSKYYIGLFNVAGGQSAHYISEEIASSPDDKSVDAVVLNLALSNQVSGPQTLTFNAAAKLYNFKRPLWGTSITNAVAADGAHVRVDGTASTNTKAVIGDEVTVLEGPNAGQVAHIIAIANQGLSNETWTLDTTLPNTTGNTIHLQLQPWSLIEKKTFTSLTELAELYFNVTSDFRGKKFMVKVLLESMTNVQLELHRSDLVYSELGYTP